MNTLSYKTASANAETIKRNWYVIDAEDVVLGRMCTEICTLLRGKHKAYYTPHVDCGDFVIVINAEKIKLTGNKFEDKEYVSNTGYPGGKRTTTPKVLLKKIPTAVVERAVRGMIPRTKLGNAVYRKLFVYAGPEHKHESQKPKTVKI